MKFSKWMGFTLTLLGSLVVLLFGVLFLVSSLPGYFPGGVDLGTSKTVTDLSELSLRLTSTNPTGSLVEAGIGRLALFGETLTPAEVFFSVGVAVTVVGLGFTLATFTSLFSPLSSGIVFTFSLLLFAAILVGSIFQTSVTLDTVTTNALPGAVVLASPLLATFLGSIFQFVYFSKRKKYRTA